jgi:hypothetical protein
MTPKIFTIPLLPMSRNERDRKHYMVRARELSDWTLMVPLAAEINMQQETDPPRLVEIVFSKTRGPESDIDNLFGRCKVPLDALVRRGWLRDDSPKWCRLEVREETRAPARQTTIAISEAAA